MMLTLETCDKCSPYSQMCVTQLSLYCGAARVSQLLHPSSFKGVWCRKCDLQ